MDDLAPSLAAEIEALKERYAAINRNDIPGFVRIFDPQVERIEPPEFPLGGTYRGLEAVTAHVTQARGSWAEGTCQPQRFIAAGDKVVVVSHVHARLKHETEWRDGDVTDVFTFRNGKAVQYRSFGSEREALEFAGATSLDAK